MQSFFSFSVFSVLDSLNSLGTSAPRSEIETVYFADVVISHFLQARYIWVFSE